MSNSSAALIQTDSERSTQGLSAQEPSTPEPSAQGEMKELFFIYREQVLAIDYQLAYQLQQKNQLIAMLTELNSEKLALLNCPQDLDHKVFLDFPKLRGVFIQPCSKDLVEKGLEAIFNNRAWFPRDLTDSFFLHSLDQLNSVSTLSKREQQIFSLVAQGLSNPEIAKLLCISLSTVKVHLHNTYRKLNISGRNEAFLLGQKGN